MTDSVIKATARIQEANEPPRQRPIIKIDPRHQQELMAHIRDADRLSNSIRASIDSGRDNPFRPDGEIYKLTSPIVDYYKYGPNQSRAQTPTYAELMKGAGKEYEKSQKSQKNKSKKLWKRGSTTVGDDQDITGVPKRRSCWRRWFCCCCNCSSDSDSKRAAKLEEKKTKSKTMNSSLERIAANMNGGRANTTTIGNNKTATGNDLTLPRVDEDCGDNQLKKSNQLISTNHKKQAKRVVLEGHEDMDNGSTTTATTTDIKDKKKKKKSEKAEKKVSSSIGDQRKLFFEQSGATQATPEATTTKVKSSRCIIS